MNAAEIQAYLAESKSEGRRLSQDSQCDDVISMARATANALAERIRTDPAFRKAATEDPSTLATAGLSKAAIYDFVPGMIYPENTCNGKDDNTCGLVTCLVTTDCICTSNTIP